MKKIKRPSAEKVIARQIREYLSMRGLPNEKIDSGAVFVKKGPAMFKLNLAERGTPDLLTCVRGRMVWIEVKESPEEIAEWERQWQKHLETKTVKASWERSIYQHTIQAKWRDAGAEIIVCSSVEECAEDIEQLIREYDAAARPTT